MNRQNARSVGEARQEVPSDNAFSALVALVGVAALPFMEAPSDRYREDIEDFIHSGLLDNLDSHYAASADSAVSDALNRVRGLCSGLVESMRNREEMPLARERTRLYRCLATTGPRPPYETEWAGRDGGALDVGRTAPMLVELAHCYRKSGYVLQPTDRADYLGVELAFAQQLLLEAASGNVDAVNQVGAFAQEHLVWSQHCARVLVTQTESEFYRQHLELVALLVALLLAPETRELCVATEQGGV